jgi:type 2 lantibiotic biosynthesis protein LanM
MGWLRERGAPLWIENVRVLDCGTHGWAEFIDHRPCRDAQQARDYFRRAGVLVGVAYVLGARDLHHENVIACGDQPVAIDVESLFQGPVRRPEAVDGRDTGPVVGDDTPPFSVLDSGLLPIPDATGSGRGFALSGFGVFGLERPAFRRRAWRHVNTDAMTMVFERWQSPPMANEPMLDGRVLSAADYGIEIEDGFRETYRFLADRRNELLAPGGPLAGVAEAPVRFLLRPSELYASLLERTLHPDCLHDGVDRSIELDVLSRPLIRGGVEPATWKLLASEIEALERMDIPYFLARGDGLDVTAEKGGAVARCLARAGSEVVAERVAVLGEEDLCHQSGLIRWSLEGATNTGIGRGGP